MNETRVVRAREGVRVPMEGAPRRYITADLPVTVPASPYYLRHLAEGDLVEEPVTPKRSPSKEV